MNQRHSFNLVQPWTKNHLVVYGYQYRLNNQSQNILSSSDANSVAKAIEKSYQFLRYGRDA